MHGFGIECAVKDEAFELRFVLPGSAAHWAGCGRSITVRLVGCALPLLDAGIVNVLAARDAVCNVGNSWIEIFLADATLFHVGIGEQELAVLLEFGSEEGGGTADEVFVHSKAAVDVVDVEADDLATETVEC